MLRHQASLGGWSRLQDRRPDVLVLGQSGRPRCLLQGPVQIRILKRVLGNGDLQLKRATVELGAEQPNEKGRQIPVLLSQLVAVCGCLVVCISSGADAGVMLAGPGREDGVCQAGGPYEAAGAPPLVAMAEWSSINLPLPLCVDTGMPDADGERGQSGLQKEVAALPVLPRYKRTVFHEPGLHYRVPGPEFGIREWEGESLGGMNYGEIVAGLRDSREGRQEMFTRDAWMGMMRLQQYSKYIDSLEDQEAKCMECVRNRRLLEQVWQTVSNEYYDHDGSFSQSQWAGELYRALRGAGGLLHTKTETYKAAKGMVANLGDKYSSFLNPFEYRLALHRPIPSELKYLAYQYIGIGVELGRRTSSGFTIVAPFAGSPAEEAGILAGEKLLSVDGLELDTFTKGEVVAFLRGPIGSTVEVEVAGSTGVRTLQIERRPLPLPPLKMKLLDAGAGQLVAYIRLHYFTHEGTKQMAAAIREGEALGVDGYILDLRNNPGGVFEEAIAMAALWLDCENCDVTETVRSNVADIEDLVYTAGKLPREIFSRHPGVLSHAPLVVITNRSSASASEVLTGALHDNHRVVTVGEKTFGKGVVQYYFPMDDGSGLKLTVAKYLTPSRYDISRQGGLEPDRSCHDYPHGTATLSDQCIEEALTSLPSMEERVGGGPNLPLPYRWTPPQERRVWAVGSY